jgi:transitional endoplasmic reticulum ATPase
MKAEAHEGAPFGAILRVVAADRDDADGALARMHAGAMSALGLRQADVVSIRGRRQTVARLAVADPSLADAGSLELDNLLCENANAVVGEQASVGRIDHAPAQEVTLVSRLAGPADGPAEGGPLARWRARRRASSIFGRSAGVSSRASIEQAALAQALEGRPVISGDRLRAKLHGQMLDFIVAGTRPEGAVVLTAATRLHIERRAGGRYAGAGVSYQDIGGLRKEIARVREMIELPLRHPQLFAHIGVDPPRGVLLYGPPGSGKTLIARAVAHESGVHFIGVNGPEVIQHGYGESEAYLRKIFQDAQEHAAAIIFIDEIDAIAPNRDTVLGDVEKRVVAQLLALMDGVSARGKIIVIAATNLPNSIDPALRRPGRFDREISLSPPDKSGRLEILRVHTRGMPLAGDVDLERVAAITHGFLGADLAALVREAGMLCARDALLANTAGAEADRFASAGALAGIRVEMKHFEAAFNEIDLSTTRDVFSEVPDVSWDDVGGLEQAKLRLREAVEWPLSHRDRFKHAGIRPPKGVLLAGAPGTGKTLIAKALAAQCKVNFIAVKGPELLSKWVGESERGIRDVFKKARQAAPSIVFFDEIDAIAPTRKDAAGGGRVSERMVGQLLLEMDSIEALDDVVVLAATNRPDLLDNALLRPGRFDVVVELPLPDEASRAAILAVHCRGRQIAPDVSLARIAAATAGATGADLGALCRRAAMQAIRESMQRDPGNLYAPFVVESRHFDGALAELQLHRGVAPT